MDLILLAPSKPVNLARCIKGQWPDGLLQTLPETDSAPMQAMESHSLKAVCTYGNPYGI
jgi:hypothetical protein